jgi:porphobilinogen synthase
LVVEHILIKEMSFEFKYRPRRLRKNPAVLSLLEETHLQPTDFILPVFIHSGTDVEEIESMPGIFRWPLEKLRSQIAFWVDSGIRGFALFPKISSDLKNSEGSEILNTTSLMYEAASLLNELSRDFILIADLALDPYTSHGQDGIIGRDGAIDNDLTVEMLAKASVLCARAGYDWVAPSDMMDGRVAAIRQALDKDLFHQVSIMAYSAKFCSSYYGPFREAIGSSTGEICIDKSSYQLCPGNAREARRELMLDLEEGADILMVKPAEPYLDIIHWAKQNLSIPIAAYQVSGEYSRVCAASQLGWLDKDSCALESLISIKRAGADLILTYFTERVIELLKK